VTEEEITVSKHVSPIFAVIVIVVALVLGALYFMTRYRTYEVRWAQESASLRQQADAAIRGRRARMDSQRRGRSGARRGAPPGAPTQQRSGEKPGAERSGSR
jgi:hypothetical protein